VAVELMYAAAPALLTLRQVAYLRDEHAVHDAVTKGDEKLDGVLRRVQSLLEAAPASDLAGTPAERQAANAVYTSFLRALCAAWKCVLHLSCEANRQVDAVCEQLHARFRVQAQHDMSAYTLDARRQVDAATEAFLERVRECVHDVEVKRLVETRRAAAQAHIPVYVHVSVCKNFMADVRSWAEKVMESLPPRPPLPSFGVA
jgi:hypothetical protein